ncbi:MarR family winged helix-turn-helix transcriptional regulator [Sphingomonas psychrolutea]|uniref:Transcriptional regulator n=1 Tax=Sphingomonas psychrolutea TaxID=1259676 RepID=A0ABQ1GX53_9SPHN|nr:MarR family transcriptional regulator [Sphingomonas psychrolutea]GGA51686.1 transcriptional regulator [Sphingomonas psychrolutea]
MPKDLNANLRFGFLVHDVSRLRRVVVDRALKPVGITRSQWWILAFLSRRDGMTQTALAADLDLTKVAIGGLLDRMEGSGYVERRSDQRDGRIKRVYLTSSGAKFLSTIRSNVQDVEQDIMAGVSDNALQVTADTLILIKRNLRSLVDGEAGDSEHS